MDWDFSKVNLEYLIRARDLTRSDPTAGGIVLGVSDELGQLLSEISPRELTLITQFKPPLVAPRHAAWWWRRLLNALQAGNPEELRVILDHAGLFIDP